MKKSSHDGQRSLGVLLIQPPQTGNKCLLFFCLVKKKEKKGEKKKK